jgi:hypothetical protein
MTESIHQQQHITSTLRIASFNPRLTAPNAPVQSPVGPVPRRAILPRARHRFDGLELGALIFRDLFEGGFADRRQNCGIRSAAGVGYGVMTDAK